jgi:flagellin-specific chaperone FliS
MYAKEAYQQHAAAAPARIDLILEVYDRILERLRRAAFLLGSDTRETRRLLNQCQIAISGMAAGLDLTAGEVNETFLLLYEYIGHCVAQGTAEKIRDAIDILQTMRDNFAAVRQEALDLERSGQIPPLDQACLQTLA